jgi:hypothetical protein
MPNIHRFTLRAARCLTVGLALAITPVAVQAAPSAAQQLQNAADAQQIQNAMGWHVWYHASYMNDVELDKVWVTTKPYTDTAVWAQNSDYFQGMDAIRAYYGPKVDQKTQAGGFQFHTLTSPIIVVADDRKTAKGVWYTPGIVGGYNGGSWLWERYGVDFVNENGTWKIWHLHVYTDFGAPASLGSGGGAGGAPASAERFGNEGGGKGAAPAGGPPGGGPGGRLQVSSSYKARVGYRELGANSYPVLIPRPPEPYKTFSETWSYADPDEYARALEAIGAK